MHKAARKAEEERRAAEAVEEQRRKEKEHARRVQEDLERAFRDEQLRQERAVHMEEALRLCADCEKAIEKKQFSNATTILASALQAFGKAGIDDDERELQTRGLRHSIAQRQAEHLKALRDEEDRLRKLQSEKLLREHDKAKEKIEREQLAAELEVQKLWFSAAAEGKYKKLESFLEKQSISDPDLRDEKGAAAIHLAAAAGHKKCVRTLLRANVPVDSQDREGRTSLHLALAGGINSQKYSLY